MRAKILIVLVLLALFGNAFAITCADYVQTTNCKGISPKTNCVKYYKIISSGPVASANRCGWHTGLVSCRTDAGTACALDCDIGGRKATTNCANLGSSTSCVTYYQTGATSKFCWWANPTVGCGDYGNTCVPEFMGIEFNEIQFSTGIIALIAAIALPTVLFRKKK
tara:strand:- start:222 stop:719 length:498 start_codon:yes stop_codon:yes gene_type:complete